MVKHFDGGEAPGDDNTAAVIVPLGLLSHEGMLIVVVCLQYWIGKFVYRYKLR